MSTSQRSPSPVARRSATCWPLVLAAVGLISLSLFSMAGLASWPAFASGSEPIASAPRNDPAPASTKRIDKAPAAKVEPTYPRPKQKAEAQLRGQLWAAVTDLDLETKKGDGKKMLEAGRKHLQLRQAAEKKRLAKKDTAVPLLRLTKTIEDLLKSRSDLRGLPLQDEKTCQSSKLAVQALASVSPRVRQLQALANRVRGKSPTPNWQGSLSADGPLEEGDQFLRDYLMCWKNKAKASLVRPLEQMIQTETTGVRLSLINTLATIEGKEATQALARRAVFDLTPIVRERAIEALGKRDLADARPIFTTALRHPWAPAANHAAIALADLDDQKAIPSLKDLLDAPDPRSPYQEGGKWQVREVVRVNHLRNCLLCHPPSTSSKDPVIGPIPVPGEPLPEAYYNRVPGETVRADVVYFRQEFSVMHKVAKPDKWPTEQRFDYMVRTRELTGKEIDRLPTTANNKPAAYPQLQAVQYALQTLTRRAARSDR